MIWQGKTIIVTGASTGIGRALAIALAQQGANLVLAARNTEALAATAQACEQAGGAAISVPTDITQPSACQQLITATLEHFGQIDSLVNNAGISMIAQFEEITDLSTFEQIMQVNYLGAVYCTHYALPHLKASQGLLVAISSLAGKMGLPTRSAYCASKHALQGFFDTLRIELRGTGVDVLVVSPGFVATEIRQRAVGGDGVPLGHSPRNEAQGTMSVTACVEQIVRGMVHRRREILMTPKGKFIPWARVIVPGFVDWLAVRATRRLPQSR